MIDRIIESFKDGKKNSLMSLGVKEFLILKDCYDLVQVDKLGSLTVYQNDHHIFITSYSPHNAEYCIVRYYQTPNNKHNNGGAKYGI